MRKLTLDLDALQVESFDTAGGGPGRGTVRGAADTVIEDNIIFMPADTFKESCMIDFCANSWQSGCRTCTPTCLHTCHTCFGQETCAGAATCITLCLATCPSGGEVCCA